MISTKRVIERVGEEIDNDDEANDQFIPNRRIPVLIDFLNNSLPMVANDTKQWIITSQRKITNLSTNSKMNEIGRPNKISNLAKEDSFNAQGQTVSDSQWKVGFSFDGDQTFLAYPPNYISLRKMKINGFQAYERGNQDAFDLGDHSIVYIYDTDENGWNLFGWDGDQYYPLGNGHLVNVKYYYYPQITEEMEDIDGFGLTETALVHLMLARVKETDNIKIGDDQVFPGQFKEAGYHFRQYQNIVNRVEELALKRSSKQVLEIKPHYI